MCIYMKVSEIFQADSRMVEEESVSTILISRVNQHSPKGLMSLCSFFIPERLQKAAHLRTMTNDDV